MSDGDDPFEFPCAFPVKALGRNSEGFREHVVELIEPLVESVTGEAVSTQASRNERFISVTVVVDAQSREQLDGIYRTLSGDERVLMVL